MHGANLFPLCIIVDIEQMPREDIAEFILRLLIEAAKRDVAVVRDHDAGRHVRTGYLAKINFARVFDMPNCEPAESGNSLIADASVTSNGHARRRLRARSSPE